MEAMQERKPLAVSLNIPFCKAKCGYCDAAVRVGASAQRMQDYLNALCAEIASIAPDLDEYEVTSLYVTGGTPNILGGRTLRILLDYVRGQLHVADDCETTLASSPDNISITLFEELRRTGLTRLEVEQETFDALQHLSLGKKFSLGALEDSAQVITEGPCKNFDVSLLYGLQGQSAATLKSSIGTCANIGATHVTFSLLRLTEGTSVREAYEKQLVDRPSSPRNIYPTPEERQELYRVGVAALAQAGFVRYTQRHFARPGFESRRVLDWCAGSEEVGFGVGARSWYGGVACENTSDLATYLAHSAEFGKILASAQVVDEAAAERRRLVRGLFALEGVELAGDLPSELEGYRACGWLEAADGRARLTLEGGSHYEELQAALS